ncbi:MAG: hypothetical protein ACQEXJ_06960 [Myxococcota bacterium]
MTMLDWHLTWQDPVALALAIAGLVLAFWFWRRAPSDTGCHACKHASVERAREVEATPRRIQLGEMRLGQSRR